MSTVALAAQVVLAAVFATAGVAKLLDLAGSRRAIAAFGVPERPAAIAGTVLPFVELAVAAALIPHGAARWGAIGALALLVAFLVGIGSAMARGITPDCNCFGALHSAPAGPRALARNALLAAVAGLVAVHGPGTAIDTWISDRSAAELVAVLVGVLAGALLATSARLWAERRGLEGQLTNLRTAVAAVPAGLPVGAMAPSFDVRAPGGGRMTLDSVLAPGLPAVLILIRPGCGPSEALVGEFERWREALEDRLTVAVVGSGSVELFRQGEISWLADALEADEAFSDDFYELSSVLGRFRIRATPSAVTITPDGTVASATVDGKPAIQALIRQALARPAVVADRLVGVAQPVA